MTPDATTQGVPVAPEPVRLKLLFVYGIPYLVWKQGDKMVDYRRL